jgi:hypothetical protein
MTRKICGRTSSGKNKQHLKKMRYLKNGHKMDKFTMRNIKYIKWDLFTIIAWRNLNFKNLVVKKFPFRNIPSNFFKKILFKYGTNAAMHVLESGFPIEKIGYKTKEEIHKKAGNSAYNILFNGATNICRPT